MSGGESSPTGAARRGEPASLPPLKLAILKRMYALAKPHRRLTRVLLVLVIVRAAQLPVIAWLSAWTIGGPIAKRNLPALSLAILGLLAWVTITGLSFAYRSRLASLFGEAVIKDLRQRVYSHLLSLPLAYFKRAEVGRIVARITQDVTAVRTGVQDVFFVSFVQSGSMLIAVALMAYYDWRLLLLVLAMAPGLWLLSQRFRDVSSSALRARAEMSSKLAASLTETLEGFREVQSFVGPSRATQAYARLVEDAARADMLAHRIASNLPPLLRLNGQLFLVLLLLVGGRQVLRGDTRIEVIIQFLFLSTEFFAGVQVLGDQYNQALTAMAGGERVFALLDTPPDWQDAADARDFDAIKGHVEFDEVCFEYEPDSPVLRGVSFVAAAGQTLALVGHTGGGKTTIVNLIAKLYLPTGGSVRIDGQDLRGMTSTSLRQRLAYVTQDNVLTSGTVLENILIGRPAATREEVWSTLERLGVADIVANLASGLDTNIGQNGARLSLGERQLVCFARAMLADPRILLLDEATSALDAATEAKMQTALERLVAGRTSFIIAHRLSTIARADQILVVDRGRIAERGAHLELLARGEIYATLYEHFARTA